MPGPYVPSGKSDPGALPVLLGATLAAAVLGGLVEGFVAQWFSLFLVFPLLVGLIAGGVGSFLISSRRVRNPLAAALIGVTAGLAAQAAVHVVAYERARSNVAEELAKDAGAAAFVREHGVDAAVDLAFAGESGQPPIVAYLQIAAKQGITITHAGGSSSGPKLTGVAVYALWLAECALVIGVAVAMLVSAAREPFCEPCEAWYATEAIVATGAGDRASVGAMKRRLGSQQMAEAMRERGRSDGKSMSIFALRGCSRCRDHQPFLELRRVTGIGKKQETKKVYTALLTQSEARDLGVSDGG